MPQIYRIGNSGIKDNSPQVWFSLQNLKKEEDNECSSFNHLSKIIKNSCYSLDSNNIFVSTITHVSIIIFFSLLYKPRDYILTLLFIPSHSLFRSQLSSSALLMVTSWVLLFLQHRLGPHGFYWLAFLWISACSVILLSAEQLVHKGLNHRLVDCCTR